MGRTPLELDSNGFVVEYNKQKQKYTKDTYGNIVTYNSNRKIIEKTQFGEFIEYRRDGSKFVRDKKCKEQQTLLIVQPQIDKNGNLIEYGADGEMFEKDRFGNVVEYTKTGLRIPKDEQGKVIELSINDKLNLSEQMMKE